MKTLKNAPFYLIVIAIVKENFNRSLGHDFKKGEELIIDQSCLRTPGYDKANEVFVKRKGILGYDVFKIDMEKFEFKAKTIVPEFNVGDIIIRKGSGSPIASKISSYNLLNGTIWYQDEWGDSQNLASGMEEGNARFATKAEIERDSWALERSYKKA